MRAFGRRGRFAVALILGVLLCGSLAPAAVQMSTGLRFVIADGSAADCSAKAETALNAFLLNAAESPAGSGEWVAHGPVGGTGPPTSGAAIHCYPVGKGYVVTFTCVAAVPGSPYAPDVLCSDIGNTFSGKPVTPLPTPTPIPTGCTTANLVGTWESNDKSAPTLKMDPNGDVTDSQDVSGSWALYGNTVTLTYYGNHTLTLSPDGKHIDGRGYNFTRKC